MRKTPHGQKQPKKKRDQLWPGVENVGALVLASASPRRAAILRQFAIPFRQIPSRVKEDPISESNPGVEARKLAEAKAAEVSLRVHDRIVVGCDTVVILGNRCLGKPGNSKEALAMLTLLNGRKHQVCSGIALAQNGAILRSCVETTTVLFRSVAATELAWYAQTGEPLDKAGAYGIQGKGGLLVKSIEGCYYNVVGFPVSKFVRMMGEISS